MRLWLAYLSIRYGCRRRFITTRYAAFAAASSLTSSSTVDFGKATV
jgi:hypothetical protein